MKYSSHSSPALTPFFQRLLKTISCHAEISYLQMADGNFCIPLQKNWENLLNEFRSLGDLFVVSPSPRGHFFRAVPSLHFETFPGDGGFYDEALEIDLITDQWGQAFFTEEMNKEGKTYHSIQFFDLNQKGIFKVLFRESTSEEGLFGVLKRQVDRSFQKPSHWTEDRLRTCSGSQAYQVSLLGLSEVESEWNQMDPFGEDGNHGSERFLNLPSSFYAIDSSLAHPMPQDRLKKEIEAAFQKHSLVRAILWNGGMVHRMTLRAERYQSCCCGCYFGDNFSEIFASWKGAEVWRTHHAAGDCLEWVDRNQKRVMAIRFEK